MNDDDLAIFKEQNETIERLTKEMEQQRLNVADFQREWHDAMRAKSKVCEELDAEKAKNAALAQALTNIAVVLKDPELTFLTEEPESASSVDATQRPDVDIVCSQCMGDDAGNRRAAEAVSSKIPRQEWPVGDPRRLPWEAKFVCTGCGKEGDLRGCYDNDGRPIPGIMHEWPLGWKDGYCGRCYAPPPWDAFVCVGCGKRGTPHGCYTDDGRPIPGMSRERPPLGWKDGYCGPCYVVKRPEIDKAAIEREAPGPPTELVVCGGCGKLARTGATPSPAAEQAPLGWENGICGSCRVAHRDTEFFVCAGCGGKALPRVPLGWEDGYCGACFAGEATGPMGIFRG